MTHPEKIAHTQDLPLGRNRLFCIQIQQDGESIYNSACCSLACTLFESLTLQSEVTVLEILPLTFNKERNMALFCFQSLCITNQCLQSRKREDYFSAICETVPLHAVIYMSLLFSPHPKLKWRVPGFKSLYNNKLSSTLFKNSAF